MDEILKTTQLEYDKSTFLIDLILHRSGKKYISLQQIIQLENNQNHIQRLRINPVVLTDIIGALNNYKNELSSNPVPVKINISAKGEKELIRRYLIGVDIDDLAVQFNCSEKSIKQILFYNNIKIVSNEIPKVKRWWWRRKKMYKYGQI